MLSRRKVSTLNPSLLLLLCRSSTAAPKGVIEEDDLSQLPSRQDLKALISRGPKHTGPDNTAITPSAVEVVVPPVCVFKEHLWSQRSRDLYRKIEQPSRELSGQWDCSALRRIGASAQIGMKNTFMACEALPGTLERIYSEWTFGSLRFSIKEVSCEASAAWKLIPNYSAVLPKELLHVSELDSQVLEPLTHMYNTFHLAARKNEMAKPPHQQSKKMRKFMYDRKVQELMRDQFNPFDGKHTEPPPPCETLMDASTTSNLPVMSGAVLKAVRKDGSLHLRPLCTTGDLLLALNQLMDPDVFMGGAVQLPDPHRELLRGGKAAGAEGVGGIFGNSQTTFRPADAERVYFRLEYEYRRHTRWTKFT